MGGGASSNRIPNEDGATPKIMADLKLNWEVMLGSSRIGFKFVPGGCGGWAVRKRPVPSSFEVLTSNPGYLEKTK